MILSLNLCFVGKIQWDNGAYARGLDDTLRHGPSFSLLPASSSSIHPVTSVPSATLSQGRWPGCSSGAGLAFHTSWLSLRSVLNIDMGRVKKGRGPTHCPWQGRVRLQVSHLGRQHHGSCARWPGIWFMRDSHPPPGTQHMSTFLAWSVNLLGKRASGPYENGRSTLPHSHTNTFPAKVMHFHFALGSTNYVADTDYSLFSYHLQVIFWVSQTYYFCMLVVFFYL